MKTAKEHTGWIRVRGMKDIGVKKPKNNDLIWYPGLCRNNKKHPAECHHLPVSVKEFRASRKSENKAKITRVYYCQNNLHAKTTLIDLKENIAVVANFIVLLVVIAYIAISMNSYTPHKSVAEHTSIASKVKKAKVTVKKTTSVVSQH